jgi:hypothetical protein
MQLHPGEGADVNCAARVVGFVFIESHPIRFQVAIVPKFNGRPSPSLVPIEFGGIEVHLAGLTMNHASISSSVALKKRIGIIERCLL